MEGQGLLSMPGVGFLGMLVIGILAGYIAEKVTASDHGMFTNLLVGIAGSFVGVVAVVSPGTGAKQQSLHGQRSDRFGPPFFRIHVRRIGGNC